jgi:hypothetical protein
MELASEFEGACLARVKRRANPGILSIATGEVIDPDTKPETIYRLAIFHRRLRIYQVEGVKFEIRERLKYGIPFNCDHLPFQAMVIYLDLPELVDLMWIIAGIQDEQTSDHQYESHDANCEDKNLAHQQFIRPGWQALAGYYQT